MAILGPGDAKVGEIRNILVVGGGPSALPGAGAVRKGGLTGKLLRDGSPLATSDDSGVWTVSEVPIGTYGMAVKIGGKWQITFGHDMGTGIKEGQVFDTGSVNLDKK